MAQVAISNITWGTIGLDSNNVNVGPNVFPVGVRITNTGDATATGLTAAFAFTTANANINLDGPPTVTIASLAPGAHADVYFNVLITRTTAAYNTSRGFQVMVSGTGFTTATSPAPREVYVEKLVSQNRNSITAITGPTAVNVGDTRTYVLDVETAPGGYEQVEAFLTFPTNLFQVLSTATTYTAPTGATNDTVYADACGWDPVPTSPTYRSCIGPENFLGGKAGGTIHTTYTLKVIGSGTANVTAAIYDFSGSSYHYNSDFGALSITVVSTSVPVVADDAFTTAEDTPLTINAAGVLVNDNDPGGAGLTAILVSQPLHGTVTLNSDGSFVYTPAANYNGPDSFTYKANNGARDSSIATVSIDVTPVNDPPSAIDDTANVAKDAGATPIDVLGNDTGAPDAGETLTITSVTQPTGGTVVITGGGTGLTFQPDPGFTGTATFTYTISDGNGGTSTATVTITVVDGNAPPNAVDNAVTVAEDSGPTPIDVLANDSDSNGDPLTITSVTQPADGTVVLTGGTGVTFQPNPDFTGTTTFDYTISDGRGGTATARVTVNVTPVNDPPDAINDSTTVAEDSGPTTIVVLGNDTTAPDAGEALTITSVTQPANGTVVITGGGTGLTFQPDPNFSGTTTFTYTISDGNGGTDTATVTVNVTPVNDVPNAVNDTTTVAENSGATPITVLVNDTDQEGNTLTITSVTQPANGTVAITGGGTGLTFTPAPGFSGTVTFMYTISDGNGGTDTATVTITVTPGPRPDRDGDGVPDAVDNCPDNANADQKDGDNNSTGDICDPAFGLDDDLRVSGGGCQAGGGAGSGALVVMIGGLAVAFGRRRRRAAAAVAVLGLVVALGVAPAVVRADDTESGNFSVERFHLAADRNGLFNIDWAEHPGDKAIDAALVTGFVDDPLVVYKQDQNNDRMVVGALVGTRATANLIGSIALHPRFSVGADLPLVIYQDRPSMNPISPSGLGSISSFGLGNLRVTPKLTLLTQDAHGVGLALLASMTLPTQSSDDAYFGDPGVSVAPAVALSRRSGAWRTGVNLGYLVRDQAKILDLTVDDELFARAGVGYDLPNQKRPVSIDLTLSTATAADDFFGHVNINHLETLVGATYQIDPQLQLFGGAGAGLAHGFGTPDARVLLGVRLTRGGGHAPEKPVELDRDHDGILDVADKCPTEPEDKDSFEDEDGCADPDNDKDGVLDVADACVLEPGIAELKGCPAKDSDGDGLADHLDKCPADPEDKDGFQDDDGCPDPDNDKDGVLDVADSCVMEPGPQANKGCPDPDRDADTVVDRLDNCPDEKGLPENAGCPKKQLVKISDDKIDLIESVYFKLDKAIIEQRSYALLDNVAAVLAGHSTLRIQVEGHTDSQGNDAYNLDLSQRRTQAVVDYLAKKGIDKARLVPKGFGETQPIADNNTKEGRAQNRRVVFTIIGGNTIQNKQQGADDSTKEK